MKARSILAVALFIILPLGMIGAGLFDSVEASQELKKAGDSQKLAKWDEAVDHCCKAIDLKKGKYSDAQELLGTVGNAGYQSHSKNAMEAESKKNYDAAVKEYKLMLDLSSKCEQRGVHLNAGDLTDRLARANQNAADLHYAEGVRQAAAKNHKAAAKEFLKVSDYLTGYKDTDSRFEQEKQQAIQSVMIVPFANRSGNGPVAEIINTELTSGLVNGNPQFLQLMPSSDVQNYLSGQVASQQDAISMGRNAKVNLVVFGNVTSVNVSEKPLVSEDHKFKYQDCIQWQKQNGVKTCAQYDEKHGRYRIYQQGRTVTVNASYMVVNTATGKIETTNSLAESSSSQKKWAEVFDGPPKKAPDEIQGLLTNMDREPETIDALAAGAARSIAGKFSASILDYYK